MHYMGETVGVRICRGRMAMHTTVDILVGGSNPGASNTAAAPPPASTHQDLPPASTHQDSNRRPKICGWVRYHSTEGDCGRNVSPIAWSLLSENF